MLYITGHSPIILDEYFHISVIVYHMQFASIVVKPLRPNLYTTRSLLYDIVQYYYIKYKLNIDISNCKPGPYQLYQYF